MRIHPVHTARGEGDDNRVMSTQLTLDIPVHRLSYTVKLKGLVMCHDDSCTYHTLKVAIIGLHNGVNEFQYAQFILDELIGKKLEV